MQLMQGRLAASVAPVVVWRVLIALPLPCQQPQPQSLVPQQGQAVAVVVRSVQLRPIMLLSRVVVFRMSLLPLLLPLLEPQPPLLQQ